MKAVTAGSGRLLPKIDKGNGVNEAGYCSSHHKDLLNNYLM